MSEQLRADNELGVELGTLQTTEQPQNDQSKGTTVILYDADADQRIPFLIEDSGESFEVAYILGAQTDTALSEYDRLCDRRLVLADAREAGERNAMETISKEFDASLWLFNDRLKDVEGFGEPGETKPENWRELIGNDQDRAAVIDSAYLAAMVVSAPPARPGKVLKWKPKRTGIVHLKALYNGFELILTHERTVEITSDHISIYNGIMKSRWLVQGTRLGTPETRIPPKSARLAALYDRLKYQTTGYAGRVPAHHKALVVIDELSQVSESLRKK